MPNAVSPKNNILPILIIGGLFFIFGFITWLNGILIPYLQIACELTDFQALFVAFVFYISYTLMALPSAWLLNKTGFKKGMMYGLWIMALGTAIFVPAAMVRTYGVFLAGLFIVGTGLAVLQTAANPYITVIGPEESAAKRISILGICNKAAGALAPLILAYFILNDGDALIASLEQMEETARVAVLDGLARRVINPYLVITGILFLLGIGINLSPLPVLKGESDNTSSTSENSDKRNIFQFPHLILGALALFFYVGAEVIAGDTIIRYGLSLGIEMKTAKVFTSLTLAFMVAGYIVGALLIPKYLHQRKALLYSGILGVAFALGIIFSEGITSVIFVALLGLANALVWPAIWPLAIKDLGKFISTGSALLIMAISGGAILPLVWGKLSDIYDSQAAFLVLIPLYAFIIFYAVKGHKVQTWKK